MRLKEFEELTGIYPSAELYAEIEKVYLEKEMDKDTFCKRYCENTNGIAEVIRCRADERMAKQQKQQLAEKQELVKKVESLKKTIEQLDERLWREEEWEPYQMSDMASKAYEELRKSSGAKVLGKEEATRWISREFGFEYDKIRVLTEIPLYERNRHHVVVSHGMEKRVPVYQATDWNYCRFDVQGWKYEVVDGELYLYAG